LPPEKVFRIFGELQEIGLVEKNVVKAESFKAVPPEIGLKIVLTKRLKRYQEMEESLIDSFQKAHWFFSEFTNPAVFS
jgi:sugar-specific transcriptional regulator TrmB